MPSLPLPKAPFRSGLIERRYGSLSTRRGTRYIFWAPRTTPKRDQINLSIEAEKRVIFCLLRGHAAAAGEQKKLIEDIRENRLNLPDRSWNLLVSRSAHTLVEDLIALLAAPKPATTTGDERSRVYLFCDPTTPDDATFAREIQERLRDQERMQVELPATPAEGASPSVQHERMLSECDGVLLYYDKAPVKWYQRNFADLLMADARVRAKELKSKALLTGSSPIMIPGLTVIQRQTPFDLGQLEPFLAPCAGRHSRGGPVQATEAFSVLPGITNPFPGLRPFESEEEPIFHARQQHTGELLRCLSAHRFLAVVGSSGGGKSSLVRAGLLPALETRLSCWSHIALANRRNASRHGAHREPGRSTSPPGCIG